MHLAFVLITHNRQRALTHTLTELPKRLGALPADTRVDTVVVDNASQDGTAQHIAATFSDVRLLQQTSNNPCAARNAGVAATDADWVCFLDDDSLPQPGNVQAALTHIQNHPTTAMIGGPVFLPNGQQDACALKFVPPACGMWVKRDAYLAVGGFDPAYHMAAEEYELAFRLANAGHDLVRLDNVRFDHAKDPSGRSPDRILLQDLRNNLVLAKRFVDEPWQTTLVRDWTARYAAFLSQAGLEDRVQDMVAQADVILGRSNKPSFLNDETFAHVFGLTDQIHRAKLLREHLQQTHDVAMSQTLPVALAGWTKTLPIALAACRRHGLSPLAVWDDAPAFAATPFQPAPRPMGLPIVRSDDLQQLNPEPVAVVVTCTNPARFESKAEACQSQLAAMKKPWPVWTMV